MASIQSPFAALAIALLLSAGVAATAGDVNRYNVVWDSPSEDADGSMPLGNGDIALNVWVEKSGDLLFYVAKSDAVSENNEPLKLGRVRVSLSPNPFIQGAAFRQELRLIQGEIVISAGTGDAQTQVRIWVDANRPAVEVEATGKTPTTLCARLELWRTEKRTIDPKSKDAGTLYHLHGSPNPLVLDPDTVLTPVDNQLRWCHRNTRSVYPEAFRNQHLESLLPKYPDPLLNRTFGCSMAGPGLIATNDHVLASSAPAASHRLRVTAITAQTDTIEDWAKRLAEMSATIDQTDANDLDAARHASANWWSAFWDRSWIDITGPGAEKVASGYALQRFMMAASSRGALPVKFNGGQFTVGSSFAISPAGEKVRDPDYRAWGGSYWFQNNRHLYWPMIAAGDFDLMEPWFRMYLRDLPLATDKTQAYYHHGGACFNETIDFWGLANNNNFGYANQDVETKNPYIRHYFSGAIEMIAMMLDRYDVTQEREFARAALVPFADAIGMFYDQHYKRNGHGKLQIEPAQSLETWQTAVNPLPEIAGLHYTLPRLLALPTDLVTESQRQTWSRLLADLPDIPRGRNEKGHEVLLPAEVYSNKRNSENTELYAVYPYRVFGVGKPDLELALQTFRDRRFKGATCWSQDPMDASLLGLADDARADVLANFSASGARFPAFWRPGHDWIPDLDNGGAGMQALQWMLMQCDGRQIRLLPAWPAGWDADFKLHAPDQTTIQAKVHAGKLVELRVTPDIRRKDIVTP